MIQLKPGVSLAGLSPQMAVGLCIVSSIFAGRMATCTVTSANDGTHKDGSKHYSGDAIDFRTKDYKSDKDELISAIRHALGEAFDVVFEAPGTDNEHLHVEWDPAG